MVEILEDDVVVGVDLVVDVDVVVGVEMIDFVVTEGVIFYVMLELVIPFTLELLLVVLIIGPLLIEDFSWLSTFGAIIPWHVNISNITIISKQ